MELNGRSTGLYTDLYHPDAAYVAWRAGFTGHTTFDLYTRGAPFGGAYLLVAGLEEAIQQVLAFRYEERALRYLAQVRDYAPGFLDYLRSVSFSGEIAAMPEGTVAFPHEPLVRVTAPFPEALLIESILLQAINAATLIATKAARITTVPSEREAFAAVAETYNRYTILLDTYDARRAIHTVIDVAREARDRYGHALAAVRLDSGDLAADSRYVREALDEAGLRETRVLVSGDLDEHGVAELVESGAPIDAFGVGTALGLPHPALGGVYKAVWYSDGAGEGRPMVKVAGEKSTWPGIKEVYRAPAFDEDVVQLAGEPAPEGYRRLLRPVVRGGEVVAGALPPLSEIRELAQENLAQLPAEWRALSTAQPYPVRFSEALRRLRDNAVEAMEAMEATEATEPKEESSDGGNG